MLFGMSKKPVELPTAETAIPDRAYPNQFSREHFVNGNPIENLCRPISAKPYLAWGAFGEQSGFSGNCRGVQHGGGLCGRVNEKSKL